MGQHGAPTRTGKSRFLKPAASSAAAAAPRALLAPPKKPAVPRAPLPPRVKPAAVAKPAKPPPVVVTRAPRPALVPLAAPVVRRVSPVAILSNADRDRLFGRFDYAAAPSAGNPERIHVNREWVTQHIVTLRISALEALVVTPDPFAIEKASEGLIGLPARGIEFHRKVAPHFESLVTAWEAEKLLHLIKTWNGSYVPRFRRGQAEHRVLSAHSWGSAFDINARWNGFKQEPAALGEEGSVLALVKVANDLGWVWGGDFSSPDGMHFEAGEKIFKSLIEN